MYPFSATHSINVPILGYTLYKCTHSRIHENKYDLCERKSYEIWENRGENTGGGEIRELTLLTLLSDSARDTVLRKTSEPRTLSCRKEGKYRL